MSNFEFYWNVADSFRDFEQRAEDEKQNKVSFGVSFLDDALDGLCQTDLCLIAARSGGGKTELATTIASNVARTGRPVVYFALEAEKHEISNRLAYREFVRIFNQHSRYEKMSVPISYSNFVNGSLSHIVAMYKKEITQAMYQYDSLKVKYSHASFTIQDLEKHMIEIQTSAKLVVIDHLHYFDLESENENKEVKVIMKKIREFVLDRKIPVVLLSHIRKQDKRYAQIVPDQDDFHGSSDVVKISTKAITLASSFDYKCAYRERGKLIEIKFHGYGTYMKAVKCRRNGGVTTSIACTEFDPILNSYKDNYLLGKQHTEDKQTYFLIKPEKEIPAWANNARGMGDGT